MMFEEVYALVAGGKICKALDNMFHIVDRAFTDGKFGEVNAAIEAADLTKLDLDTWIGLLSITLCAKNKLPARTALVVNIETRLRVAGESEKRIEGLLGGLR